jgi:tRNA(adenine34) deaminase
MNNENTINNLLGHDYFMKQALKQAQQAFDEDEVPIGCVVVVNNKIIGKGYNQTERLKDPTAHAEMLAITAATNYLGAKYLDECTVYVTIEPCTMCAGALYWTRPQLIVYGASEPKVGFTLHQEPIVHPKTTVLKGVLADDCSAIMTAFFEKRRT